MARQKFQVGDEALHIASGKVGVMYDVLSVDCGYYRQYGSRKYYVLDVGGGRISGYSNDFQHHKIGVDDLL